MMQEFRNCSERALDGVHIASVSIVIDSGFLVSKSNDRLYDMVVCDNWRVWMGGPSCWISIKTFTAASPYQMWLCICICMDNTELGFIARMHSSITCSFVWITNRLSSLNVYEKRSKRHLTTALCWRCSRQAYGITGSASGNHLACLRQDDQSKVIRYSSKGTKLQEIQYVWQGQPPRISLRISTGYHRNWL